MGIYMDVGLGVDSGAGIGIKIDVLIKVVYRY